MKIKTSSGTIIIARCIIIAGGAGSFVPRRPTIDNIKDYEEKSVFYSNWCDAKVIKLNHYNWA